MNCLKEIKIEKYILGLTELNKTEIQHILNCDCCRDKYEFFKDFYDELDSENEFNLESLLDKNLNMTVLTPMKPISTPDNFKYRLAAQSEKPTQKYVVFHFSNDVEGIVGRVMQEKQTQNVFLYLISEDKEKISGRKVKIVDSDLEAITDSKGVAFLGKQEEFTCNGIQIKSPLATFDLTPHNAEKQVEMKHVLKLKNKNHDEIHITIDEKDLQKSYRISINKISGTQGKKELQVYALTNNNRLLSQTTEKGISVFETEKNEQILKIHIF